MNYELIKNELIKIKKEELNYIDNVAKISSNRVLSETEKIDVYRVLDNYKNKLAEILRSLCHELIKNKKSMNITKEDVIIEFDIDRNFLSSVKFNYEEQKKHLLSNLGIDLETLKFKITYRQLLHNRGGYSGINCDDILSNQRLINEPIYIFCGIYDTSEDCCGIRLGEADGYLYGIYKNIRSKYNDEEKEVPKKDIDKFEKNKIIIHSKRYVHAHETRKIFEEELLNSKNQTLNDCVIQTKTRIEELNYIRSPEYKEKILLDRINELYKKVKGQFIREEILYSGQFLQILRETYKLPNENRVEKEKVVKNGGKDSVLVIAITQEKEYIITFQNRINDKLIAEFPSGYIENDEDPIETAKRELKEETGYISVKLYDKSGHIKSVSTFLFVIIIIRR